MKVSKFGKGTLELALAGLPVWRRAKNAPGGQCPLEHEMAPPKTPKHSDNQTIKQQHVGHPVQRHTAMLVDVSRERFPVSAVFYCLC